MNFDFLFCAALTAGPTTNEFISLGPLLTAPLNIITTHRSGF